MTQTLNNFFKNLIEDYKHYRAVQATMKELSKLTDRELSDIGLARGDIYSVAQGDATMRRRAERKEASAPVNVNLVGAV